MFFTVLSRLSLEALGDIFYWPLWWYSHGVRFWGKKCLGWLASGNRRLSPGVWLANLFVPMFGQHDWQGRMISFFMRLVQAFFRGVVLFLWLVVCLGIFAGWFLVSPLIIYGLWGGLTNPRF